MAAFNIKSYWLYGYAYHSLFYLQFIGAHGLSAYLMVYQHLKRLPEVCYCHHLFWILSLFFSFVYFKTSADLCSMILDAALFFSNTILFITVFFRQKTINDFSVSTRPLIPDDNIVLKRKVSLPRTHEEDVIDVKFRSKLISYQGGCFFEFKVYLP